MKNFEAKFKSWLKGSQKIITDYATDRAKGSQRILDIYNNILTVKKGRRYIKILTETSVWAFIDMTNGNVLKAASYKAPSKISRGNIFDEFNGLNSITPYGPANLR